MPAAARTISTFAIAWATWAATSSGCTSSPLASTGPCPATVNTHSGARRNCAWSKPNGSFHVVGLIRAGDTVLLVAGITDCAFALTGTPESISAVDGPRFTPMPEHAIRAAARGNTCSWWQLQFCVVDVELRHLEAFQVLADELNFTRAAGRSHITHQALSTQLRQLENRLGASLFERTTRSVTLTDAGRTLLGHVPGIVAAGNTATTAT